MEPAAIHHPVTITRSIDLDAPADELWQLIADPERLADWLGDSVEIDLRPGGGGTVVDDGVTRRVLVERVHQGRELAFTWWEADEPANTSRVVFEIGSAPDGTDRITVTETFVAASDHDAVAARDRWEVRVLSLWACTVVAALVQ